MTGMMYARATACWRSSVKPVWDGEGKYSATVNGTGLIGQLRERERAQVLLHVAQQRGADGLAVEHPAGDQGPDHGAVLVGLQQRADLVHEPERIQPDRNGLDVDHGQPAARLEQVVVGEPAGIRVRSANVHG